MLAHTSLRVKGPGACGSPSSTPPLCTRGCGGSAGTEPRSRAPSGAPDHPVVGLDVDVEQHVGIPGGANRLEVRPCDALLAVGVRQALQGIVRQGRAGGGPSPRTEPWPRRSWPPRRADDEFSQGRVIVRAKHEDDRGKRRRESERGPPAVPVPKHVGQHDEVDDGEIQPRGPDEYARRPSAPRRPRNAPACGRRRRGGGRKWRGSGCWCTGCRSGARCHRRGPARFQGSRTWRARRAARAASAA